MKLQRKLLDCTPKMYCYTNGHGMAEQKPNSKDVLLNFILKSNKIKNEIEILRKDIMLKI